MCWQFTVDFSQTGRRKICAGLLQTINKLQRHKREKKEEEKKKETLQKETILRQQRSASAAQRCTSVVFLCKLLSETDTLTPVLGMVCEKRNVLTIFIQLRLYAPM